MKKAFLTVVLLFLAAALCTAGGCGHAEEPDTLAGWSTEEKVGQLFLVGFQGTELTPETADMLTTIHPAGVILFGRNIEDADQLNKLITDLQNVATGDTGYPLLVATDQEGGQIVRIKWLDDGVSESQIKDTGEAYQVGLRRGQGLQELGINLNLAPVLDMGEQGDFLTKYGRTFQGDPQQVGELGASVISGQNDGGIFSTAKHFPGYGGIDFDPENDKIPVMADVPEISQFRIACQANPEFVMTANVIYNQIDPDYPFTLSPAGIDYMGRELGDGYLIISDDLASKVLKEKYSLPQTVLLAAQAGVDVLLISGNQAEDPMQAFNALVDAVKSGEMSEEELNARVSRILRLKEAIPPGYPTS